MTIHVSWADKRHVTLRSAKFPRGAQCHHFRDEAEAEEHVKNYLADATAAGFTIVQHCKGEWTLTK